MSALFHPYLCGRIAAEWLIKMNYKDFSEQFQEFYFWFISDNPKASYARSRLDIPLDLVTKLDKKELEIAKQLLFNQFEISRNKDFYIRTFIILNDNRAIPYIKKYMENIKKRGNGNFLSEIKLCKYAIKKLEEIRRT